VGLSRRKLIEYGAAGAVAALASGKGAGLPAENPEETAQNPLPMQVASDRKPGDRTRQSPSPGLDIRELH